MAEKGLYLNQMPMRWVLFLILAQQGATASTLSQILYQLNSNDPCWEVTKDEIKPLINEEKKCGGQVNPKVLQLGNHQRVYDPFVQDLIFQMAAREYNETAQCLKGMLELIKKKDKPSGIYDSWIGTAGSHLAYSLQSRGIAAREKILYDQKKFEAAPFLPLAPDKKLQAQKEKEQELEKLARSIGSNESDAWDRMSEVPFISHPFVRKAIDNEIRGMFPIPDSALPENIDIIEKKIYERLHKISPKLFASLSEQFDRQIKLDPTLPDHRKQLFDLKFVERVLNKTQKLSEPTKAKLNSCVQGDYGPMAKRVDFMRDTATAIGSVGPAMLGSVPLAAWGIVRWNAKLILGGFLGQQMATAPSRAIQVCLDQIDLVDPVGSLDCKNTKNLNAFAMQWLESDSCLMAIFDSIIF